MCAQRERRVAEDSRVRTRLRIVTTALLAAAAALVADPAPAQDAPTVHVRVLSIAGSGDRSDRIRTGGAAAEPTYEGSELDAPWIKEELRKLPDDKFKYIGESTRTRIAALSAVGKPHTFEQLPAGHWAQVTLKKPGDTFTLEVKVTRRGPKDESGQETREKVVDADLKVKDGGHCVVRCVGALHRRTPAGVPGIDLLLLITAQTKPF